MQPLQLTVELASPAGIGHPYINSDGLVAHLVAVEEYGREYLDLVAESMIKGPTDLDLDLPLKKTAGVRHASVSLWDCDETYSTNIYKRYHEPRAHEVDSRRRYINKGSGEYRSAAVTQPYVAASRARFYFYGDLDRLRPLFERHLAGLGKKRAAGFGQITSMAWEVIDEDQSLIHDGKASRPIPIDRLESWSDEAYLSWKPPYWADENHARCAPPGAEVEMKHE